MGWRFRKSIGLGRIGRLNLSRSGASVSVRVGNVTLSAGPRGVRRTVSIPGSGLSHSSNIPWPKETVAPPTTWTGDKE